MVTKRREPEDEGELDGRVLRGDRSRRAIVEALYEIVRDGELEPSAEAVAERAGVGVRTVFRQFDDMEALYQAMGDRVRADVLRLAQLSPPTGELATDLRTVVARRARVFEYIIPFRRSGRIVRHRSSSLRTQESALNEVLRVMIEAVVAPHLAPEHADTLEALDLVLSFEAWDRLRGAQGLSRARAERVLAAAAAALVHSAASGTSTPTTRRAPIAGALPGVP